MSAVAPSAPFARGILNVVAVALVCFAPPVMAQVNIPSASSAPTVDGNLDSSWSAISGNTISNTTGTISSTGDCSGTWKAQWNSTDLYALIEVTDDDKRNDSTNIWEDDSVEFYIDGNNDKATSYDTNDRQYIFGWGDTAVVEGGARNSTGVTFAKADPSSTSYRIEARIPWSAVGVTASAGKVIGIEAHVNDDDAGGTREGKRMWNDTTDTAWQNPSVFGTATLQGAGQGTYGNSGNPWSIASSGTTRIQAENYDTGGQGVAYNDSDTTNSGAQYRTDGVDIEATTDTGGGYNVGWVAAGEWLEYTVNVASAGTYDLKLRVARSPTGSSSVRVLFDGADKTGSMSVPSTGGWQTWTTITASGVSLSAGTQVMRVDLTGSSYNVNWIEVTAASTPPPAAPTGLTATAGDAQVALSWTASSGATSYNVKRSTTSGGPYTTIASPTTTSYTNTGLTNGTTYYYVVTAVNSGGESANSSQVSATPAAPSGGTANIAAGTITVDATIDSAWSSAIAYTIGNITGTISSTSDASGTFKGLWDSTNLFVLAEVTDDNKSNDSTDPWQDDSVEVYLDGNNDKTTSYDTNDRQYIFGWNDTAVLEPAGRSATGVTFAKADPTSSMYRIEAKIPWSTLGVTASSGKNIGLDVHINDDDAGGSREGKRQWNDTGTTAWQNPSVFGIGELQASTSPPTTPTGLAATAGDGQVSLSWNASSGAESYNLKRSTTSGSGYSTVASPTTTSYTNTGLTNGVTYYYVVSAVNPNGESANSSQVSATPTAPPSGDGSPYGGTARAIPGTIQSEDYNTGGQDVAYSDTDATNSGGAYRTSEGVDIEPTTDTGGGYNVGWTANTEYLKYTVNVGSTGNYDIRVRHAGTASGTIRIEFGGVDKTGNITLSSTGGWQTWTDTVVPGVSLSSGQQVMRVVLLSGGFNLNYVAVATAGSNPSRPAFSAHVKVCQVGYLPGQSKYAMLTAAPTGPVVVRRSSDNASVLSVNAGSAVSDADSGDSIRLVDFSSVATTGTYYLDAPGVGSSYDFRIASDAFTGAYRAALRSFYGQRCGMEVNMGPDYPSFSYTACHTASSQFHSSTGKSGSKSSTRGWHDAGDYGKYIVNSGITTGTLLWTYEFYSSKIGNINLNIPESTNSIPDILDEIKWNLDWMLTLQETDGGVYHKMTTANFPGFIMPQNDTGTLYIVGTGTSPWKCTAATADFSAVMAIASRLFRPYNATLADQYLSAARSAYTWASNNPNSNFTGNPSGISTGAYSDSNPRDERLWAAAELFRTTGESQYNTYFLSNYGNWSPKLSSTSPHGWPNVANLAMYTYALSGRSNADTTAVNAIKADAVAAADGIVSRARGKGYRIPLASGEYYWGSNSVAANYAMMCLIANRFTPKADYTNTSQDVLHYFFGRNTFNTSFVTQVGDKWAMNPHHRPSGADGNVQPWPGLIVGGPNAEGATPPARQWFDVQESYTTNENAINWNAPLVFLLAEAMP